MTIVKRIHRVAKMQRIPSLYRSFSVIEPYDEWLFCGERPATEGMLCIFAALQHSALISEKLFVVAPRASRHAQEVQKQQKQQPNSLAHKHSRKSLVNRLWGGYDW